MAYDGSRSFATVGNCSRAGNWLRTGSKVLVLGPSHARLALSAHHALVDESGLRTFLHDAAQEYREGGRGTGRAAPSILDASRRRVARDGADDRAAATALAIERLESLDVDQPATAAAPRALHRRGRACRCGTLRAAR